jgi:exopolyphosphatase/guanosine-5'-triphosphate,3'-diphosphate pyrophosphatase
VRDRVGRRGPTLTRVAAVDCGTNTIKLLIADLDEGGGETELVRETRMVRLGQDVDSTGRLADEALARVFAAVEEYAALVDAYDVATLRFCATSAARDASNADAFTNGVRTRLGVSPEVLTGVEEARLAYAGATRTLSDVRHPVLVVDIGGGSTELVLGDAEGLVAAGHSLDIGAVRLTERLLHTDPPTDPEIAAALSEIDTSLDLLPEHGVHVARAETVVAVSGTGLTVAAAVLDLPALDRELVDGAVVPVAGVHEATERLVAMRVDERRALPYMHPRRADVIAAGALILDRVIARTSVEELRVSVRDILDGIAWSQVSSP